METTKELLTKHNLIATKPLKAWKGKRSDLIARINKLLPARGPKIKSKKLGIGAACYELLGKVLYYEDDGGVKHDAPSSGCHPVGIAYSKILKRVNDRFPESAVNRHHLRWYANRMRSLDMPIPAHREKSEWDDAAA